MQSSARALRLPLLIGLAALLFCAACPTVKLGGVTVVDGSVGKGGLTLRAEVIVEETETTDGEQNQASSGRGVIGLHLPDGWTVKAARVQVPGEAVARKAYSAPQAAAIFADAFPGVTDTWWAFASNEQTIRTGRWRYQVELDLVAPKKARGARLGLLATVLQDDMSDIPAPAQFDLALQGKKTSLSPVGAAPAAEGGSGDKVPAGL